MNYKKIKSGLKKILWIIQVWIKKWKGLNKNGELPNNYNKLTKKNYIIVFQDIFNKINVCYIDVYFKDINFSINTLLWKDEVENIKKILNFPCAYEVLSSNTTKISTIKLIITSIPTNIKYQYSKLTIDEFIKYITETLRK